MKCSRNAGGENVSARKRAVLVREKVRDACLVQRSSVPSCFCRDSGLVRCARGRARPREEKSIGNYLINVAPSLKLSKKYQKTNDETTKSNFCLKKIWPNDFLLEAFFSQLTKGRERERRKSGLVFELGV